MKNQTEYYINVYKWRDMPQGIYTIWSDESASRSMEDAIESHEQVLLDFNKEFKRVEYLTTHTHKGEINLLEELAEEGAMQLSYGYLAALSDKGEM